MFFLGGAGVQFFWRGRAVKKKIGGGGGQKIFDPKFFYHRTVQAGPPQGLETRGPVGPPMFLVYIKFLIVRSSITFLTATSNVNNSVIFHRRKVPRVANERYCYIFFIFGVHWGKGVKGGPLGGTKKKRKTTKIAEKRKTSSVNNAAKIKKKKNA